MNSVPKRGLLWRASRRGGLDVEVGRALVGIPGSHASQRTPAPIHREDDALDQHHAGHGHSPQISTARTSDGDGDDASGDDEPDRRVQQLDPDEHEVERPASLAPGVAWSSSPSRSRQQTRAVAIVAAVVGNLDQVELAVGELAVGQQPPTSPNDISRTGPKSR